MTNIKNFILLLKLKLRHAKTLLFLWASGFFATDFSLDKQHGDRVYQIYCFVFVATCLGALWFALINFATQFFAGLGTASALEFFKLCLVAPLAIFSVVGIASLRKCPIKLSFADIAYVAASPISLRIIVFHAVFVQLFGWGLFGCASGYLLFVCLQSGLVTSLPLFIGALFGGLVALLILLASWIIALMRFLQTSSVRYSKLPQVLSIITLLTMLFISILALSILLQISVNDDISLILFLLIDNSATVCLTFLAVIMAQLLIIAALSPRCSMSKIIDANILYANLYKLNKIAIYDITAYRELYKQKRLLFKKPILHMPKAVGWQALSARAIISGLRQFERLPSIVFWGVSAAPLSVLLLLTPPEPFWLLSIAWIAIVLVYPNGAREQTRVFREDIRNRLLRHKLPFSTFQLFVYDTLPTFALTTLISVVVVVFLAQGGQLPIVQIIVAVLINAMLTLCMSLDGLQSPFSIHTLSYELAVIPCVVALFLASTMKIPLVIIVTAGVCVLSLLHMLKNAREV